MELSDTVRKILSNYGGDNPGTKGNLARFLMQGRLGGTGKMIILPVDQGVEHGPGPQLRGQRPGLRPDLPPQAGDRGRAVGLCGAPGRAGSQLRGLSRSGSDDPEAESRQQPGA